MIKFFGIGFRSKLFGGKAISRNGSSLKLNFWNKGLSRAINTGRNENDTSNFSIVTVDKWGVKRNANAGKEDIDSKLDLDKSECVIELTQKNVAQVIRGKVPTIIEAYQNTEVGMAFSERLLRKVSGHLGFIRIARFDPENDPELAISLQIAQIPATIGVFNGRAVSYFFGIMDDKGLDEFIGEMLKLGGHDKVTDLVKRANDLLERGDIDGAKSTFDQILQNPNFKSESVALAGLARCFIDENRLEEARELVRTIEENYPKDTILPQVVQVKRILELKAENDEMGMDVDIEQLRRRIEESGTDFESHYNLVKILWNKKLYEESIEELLKLIKKDRNWNDQAGRKLIIKFFEVLGSDNPITIKARKRFSNIWF